MVLWLLAFNMSFNFYVVRQLFTDNEVVWSVSTSPRLYSSLLQTWCSYSWLSQSRTLFFLLGIISLFIICIGIIWNNSCGRQMCQGWGLNPGHRVRHALLHMAPECFNHLLHGQVSSQWDGKWVPAKRNWQFCAAEKVWLLPLYCLSMFLVAYQK